MDRLLSMSVFVKAVETGSFSAAGEVLQMSSQLVGKHVQALEQHLGVRLLNRTTRRQHLTEFGQSYYERAKSILADVDAAEGLAAENLGIPRGRLRINAPVSFGIHALAKCLPEYLAANPEVNVDMSLTNRYVDIIDEGFDAAFRIGELADSGLVARRLAPYRLVLCAAPAYLRTHPQISQPQDLSTHECLGFPYTELRTHWSFEHDGGLITIPVGGRFVVDNGEALLSAALAGMGLLLQPWELVQPQIQAGLLVPVLPSYPVPVRPMHILYAPDRRMTPKLRSFIDFVIAVFGHGNDKAWNVSTDPGVCTTSG